MTITRSGKEYGCDLPGSFIQYIIPMQTSIMFDFSTKKYLIESFELLDDGQEACLTLDIENDEILQEKINKSDGRRVFFNTTINFASVLDEFFDDSAIYDVNLLQVILSYLNPYCNIDVFINYKFRTKNKKQKINH